MARPTIATPDLTEKVATLVRAGNLPLHAAKVCRIAPGTYWRWMQRGRLAGQAAEDAGTDVPDTERPYWEFWESVTRAESESQVLAISDLRKQWGRSANAVIAWLERRFPKEWSRTEKREVSGPDGGPIEVHEGPRQRLERRLERIGQRLLEEAAADVAMGENGDGGERGEGTATEGA